MRHPLKIEDYQDAILWLGYWGRFCTSNELRLPAAGAAAVLVALKSERDEAMARAHALAKRLEELEAKHCGGAT